MITAYSKHCIPHYTASGEVNYEKAELGVVLQKYAGLELGKEE